MKTIMWSAILLAGACARDSRPATAPPAPPAPRSSQAGVPDLQITPRPVDGLPISGFVDPGAATKEPIRQAVAVLYPTAGQRASGVVRFVETEGRGIEVYAVVHGLSERPHAYHVHVFGDCSARDATSAGPHFHFTGSSLDPEATIITGNLGTLQRQGQSATHRTRIADASLQGEFSIVGRAVVVHERGNNPEVTPDGGAGARIACGVIGVANPRPPQTAKY